jgi:hypothetical protein
LSNSLKFTNKNGRIKVLVKILNQQLISHPKYSEQSQEQIIEEMDESKEIEIFEKIKRDYLLNQESALEDVIKEGQERFVNI